MIVFAGKFPELIHYFQYSSIPVLHKIRLELRRLENLYNYTPQAESIVEVEKYLTDLEIMLILRASQESDAPWNVWNEMYIGILETLELFISILEAAQNRSYEEFKENGFTLDPAKYLNTDTKDANSQVLLQLS